MRSARTGTSESVRRSLVLTLGGFVNVLLGFAFQLLLAHKLGVTSLVDIYSLSTAIPTVAATVLLASTPGVLVPFLAANRRAGVELPLRALLPTSLAVVGAVLVGVTTAPFLSRLLARGQAGLDQHTLTLFVLLATPVILIAWLAAVCEALAVSSERFGVVALSSAANGVGLLGVAVCWVWTSASAAILALAFVSGYLVQLIYIAARCMPGIRWNLTKYRGRSVTTAMMAMMATGVISKSQPVTERLLAVSFHGGPAIMNYASRLTQSILLVATLGLALIALPKISQLVADGRNSEAANHAIRAACDVCALAAPVCATAFVVAPGIVNVVFGGARFSADDTDQIARVLAVASIGIYFGAATGPLVNYLYATSRYRFVAGVAISTALVGAALSFGLSKPFGLAGIATGTAFVYIVNLAIFARSATIVVSPHQRHVLAAGLMVPFGAALLTVVVVRYTALKSMHIGGVSASRLESIAVGLLLFAVASLICWVSVRALNAAGLR